MTMIMLTDRPGNRELGKVNYMAGCLAAWRDNNMSRPEPNGLHMAYLPASVLRRWEVGRWWWAIGNPIPDPSEFHQAAQ